MKFAAIIWGSCGSLPSPLNSKAIYQRLHTALWEARNEQFKEPADIDAFLLKLPRSIKGTYGANTSCVQIETENQDVIFCDAGTGIHQYARSLPPTVEPRTYHIFLSHLHWDHIQGFPFFSPAYAPENRIIFHGFHPETERLIRQQMEAPLFPVPLESMSADIEFDIRKEGESFDLGDVKVHAIHQNHPGGSWGYRFEQGEKTIVYSTDAEHHLPETKIDAYPFVRFFDKADILIFDAQYNREQICNEKRNWGHSDPSTAITLAKNSGVRHLVLFHHEPGLDDAAIESMLEEALQTEKKEGSFPQQITLAYDGLRLNA